jgi:putative protease
MSTTDVLTLNTSDQAVNPPELLSPAGNFECVRAAVENGADAVYFGLNDGFNARARAANFQTDDLPEVMRYLHQRGVRGYITLNTLAFSDELPAVERIIRQLADADVDALLVQDIGVARLSRRICPELPLHASTQMTITSAECLTVAKELGIERAVLARELSIDEIRAIHQQTEIDLEVFVHGALCVAYSGQCLTSEAMGGRSANRGQCAQACRLPWELVCDDRLIDAGDQKYLLSPQDLAAYSLTRELIEAGVASFKIEGRLKTPEYVANITRHYRDAIDTIMSGKPLSFSRRRVQQMEQSFSRGFSPGWLKGCDHKMLVPGLSSSKRGVLLGTVTAVHHDSVSVNLEYRVAAGDGIVFEGDRSTGSEQGGRVFEIFRDGVLQKGTVEEGTVRLGFDYRGVDLSCLRPGMKLWKTDDPQLNHELRRSFDTADPVRRVNLTVNVTARTGHPLTLEAVAASGARCTVVSEQPLQLAVKHPLTREILQLQLSRLGGTIYQLHELNAMISDQPMVPLSVLGQLRRQMISRLNADIPVRSRTMAPDSVLQAMQVGIKARSAGPSEISAVGRKVAAGGSVSGSPERWGQTSRTTTDQIRLTVLCRTLEQLTCVAERHQEIARACDRTDFVAPGQSVAPGQPGPEWHVSPPASPESVRGSSSHSSENCRVQIAAVADFQDLREFREAAAVAAAHGLSLLLATPRIQKPDELGIFRMIRKHCTDGVLVRNLAGLRFFIEQQIPVVADFSLNVTNELTAEFLMMEGSHRVTPSYDLNREQLLDLVKAAPPEWLEVVIHQHMPMFHMEHCVFCAMLSPGTNKTNCGRPCDIHKVEMRDRSGVDHPLTADVGCRNTLFNAVPQSSAEIVQTLLKAGVRNFRIELLRESPEQVLRTLQLYLDLLKSKISGTQVWKALNAANQVGVTRGTLEARSNPLPIL